ncbi:SDR family oxidoreductase [Aeromicrobium sp. CTD01-1L150]|uniref:SDR family oxidoreductase n=1 Tax=Aeromicrobium sp. CTD01-1L150 TaxID=3341830 RepID=UPI0035BF937B
MASPDLQGRTAIVTGASRGIGLAIAAALHEDGANVVLTARKAEDAEAAAATVGPNALGVGAHATDEDAARRCVELTLERFGSVDVLVNNAGTNPAFGPLVDQEHGRFAKTMDVNLWAPVLWSGIVWHAWMKEHGGSIINTASVGGLAVGADLGVYHASKAALIHVTRHLALELAPGVRVNAVAPGVVRTRLAEALWRDHEDQVIGSTPLGRVGEPEDIGGVVAFLAGDRSRWITGETIVTDGGQMLVASSGDVSASS